MSYPTLVLKNQFGEQSSNYILDGSSGAIDVNFIVDLANGNGLGLRSVKGNAIKNVFMKTSSTPAAGNPNPGNGIIIVQFKQNYLGYNGGYAGFGSPVSGTPINVTTGVAAGLSYIITSLGTSTAADFHALGLGAAFTPAVGMSFVAPAIATGTGTGTIEVPKATGAGIDLIDVIGDPNLTCAPSDNSGAIIVLRCLAGSTLAATAPADGTVIGLRFVMDGVALES